MTTEQKAPLQGLAAYLRSIASHDLIYGSEAYQTHMQWAAEVDAQAAQPAQQRPPNCGTGYCSCIECVMIPEAAILKRIQYQVSSGEPIDALIVRADCGVVPAQMPGLPLNTINIAQGRRFVVHGENGPSEIRELCIQSHLIAPGGLSLPRRRMAQRYWFAVYSPRTACWASYHPNAEGKKTWRTQRICGDKLNPSHWKPLDVAPVADTSQKDGS